MAGDCIPCGGGRPRKVVVRNDRVQARTASSAQKVSYRVIDPAGATHEVAPDTLVAARQLRNRLGGAIRTVRG